MLDGPICELPDNRALRVWVEAPPDAVRFSTPNGRAHATKLRELNGGAVYQIVVPTGAFELRVIRSADRRTRVFRLAPSSAPRWLARAKGARARGDTATAAAIVRAAEASSDLAERAFALGMRARLELTAGRQEASFPLFRESIRLHRGEGRLSDAADDSFALAFALNQRSHKYSEARDILDEVHAWTASYPDGRARESYYRGTLATETGDARAALRLLTEAREHAAKLGLSTLERNAVNAYALQLELVGRQREALELLRELERDASTSTEASACEKVEIAINLGFGMLLENAQTEREGGDLDATASLERALVGEACKDAYLRTAALGNLALAALQRGEPALARTHLRLARKGQTEARGVEVLFWNDLEGRIALAERDARRALAAFEEEARLAASMMSFDAEWRAAEGKGEALELLGQNEAALVSYRVAEERLTTLSFLVPLGEGRATFVGDRGRSARFAIDLLVRLGRAKEALDVARASRARMIAGLSRSARVEGFRDADRVRWEKALGAYRDARSALDAEAKDDWKLPRGDVGRVRGSRARREAELRAALDDAFSVFTKPSGSGPAGVHLAPLPPVDLTVAFHPARSGWVGLVADGPTVTGFAIPRLPPKDEPARLTEQLLAPIRPRLEHARRLRLLPYGELRAVDFHSLPYEGVPLASRVAIEYPLDLPPTVSKERTDSTVASALVIADPTLDLEGARAESDYVVRVLRNRAWRVALLEGPGATSASVLALLSRSQLLHYAGHGVFAGREGWQSTLPLAGGGHLGIGDVLASSSVPSRVVLSSCETALTDDAPAESLGLAQAFVLAGADFVIAPVRPVDDQLALRMSTALYGGLSARGNVDAAAILQDAQLRIRAESPSADWSAFRVVCR